MHSTSIKIPCANSHFSSIH